MTAPASDAAPTPPATWLEAHLRPLAALLADPAVIEIAVNGDGSVWIERAGEAAMRPACLADPPDVARLAASIAAAARIGLGAATPVLSARIPLGDGGSARAQVLIPPAVDGAGAVALRRQIVEERPLAAFGFLDGGEVDAGARRRAALAALWDAAKGGDPEAALRIAIRARLTILVAGGTSTAKTSLARALLAEIDPAERLITIEDAVELAPAAPNQVRLVAERSAESPRAPARLLEAALRLRPDRIVLGELRGAEAFAFLEAINTGHGGSITTIHAETPALALDRIAMLALGAGRAMPFAALRRYAGAAIDVIVQLGRRDGRRGLLEIAAADPR